MMQTLNPCSTTTAKTAEIMARYRPIAPRPDVQLNPVGGSEENGEENSSMAQNIRQSPYLRAVWPHLQARPTRTRKRGRNSFGPIAVKRSRTAATSLQAGLPPPCQVLASPAKNLSLQGFTHFCPSRVLHHLPTIPTLAAPLQSGTTASGNNTVPSTLVTLPMLPFPSPSPMGSDHKLEANGGEQSVLDLNKAAEENDFRGSRTNVIAPQPVRLVGSRISVKCITVDPSLTTAVKGPKKPEEVEEELESEVLPAIVTDSSNKVRVVNSAYKEMVGQPECSWLDSMVTYQGRRGGAAGSWKRICGGVVLQLPDSGLPVHPNGFSCWLRIEWGNSGKKSSTSAFCEATRLSCESKDYLYIWRFHTGLASESSGSRA